MRWIANRKLSLLFAAATLLPASALGWLAVRTLEQESQLARQRTRERLEVAAQRVLLEIERHLQTVESRLTAGVGIQLQSAGITATGGQPILYQPTELSAVSAAPAALFGASQLEYRQGARSPALSRSRQLHRVSHRAHLHRRALPQHRRRLARRPAGGRRAIHRHQEA